MVFDKTRGSLGVGPGQVHVLRLKSLISTMIFSVQIIVHFKMGMFLENSGILLANLTRIIFRINTLGEPFDLS